MISSYRFLQQYSSRYLVFIPERSFGYCNNKQLEIEPPFTMSDSPSHTPSLRYHRYLACEFDVQFVTRLLVCVTHFALQMQYCCIPGM